VKDGTTYVSSLGVLQFEGQQVDMLCMRLNAEIEAMERTEYIANAVAALKAAEALKTENN
jgi:hypothetical protein